MDKNLPIKIISLQLLKKSKEKTLYRIGNFPAIFVEKSIAIPNNKK